MPTDESTMYLYFRPAGRRKAECWTCHALTKKSGMSGHALWHVNQSGFEPSAKRGFGPMSFGYVAVSRLDNGTYMTLTSPWVVSDPMLPR